MCIRLDRSTNKPNEIPLSISLQFSHDDDFAVFRHFYFLLHILLYRRNKINRKRFWAAYSHYSLLFFAYHKMYIASSLIAAWHRFVYRDGFVDRLSLIFSWRLLDALISFFIVPVTESLAFNNFVCKNFSSVLF